MKRKSMKKRFDILTDEDGERYIEVTVHNDRAYIIRRRGDLVLTKPFDGGNLSFSSYSAGYRVYSLEDWEGKELAEFEGRKAALEYFDWITKGSR